MTNLAKLYQIQELINCHSLHEREELNEYVQTLIKIEVSKILVDLEESEKQYEKFAHMAFYSKHL